MGETNTCYIGTHVNKEFYWELKKRILDKRETMQIAIIKALCDRYGMEYPEKIAKNATFSVEDKS